MTMRSVQDRFWSDGWVRRLNPLDRYLFLYLLTNEHTNWAGVYELEIGMMAFESGIDRDELQVSMLPRLSPKIIYVDGWVYIPNWAKHHMSDSGTLSPQQKEGIRKAKDKIPEYIRRKMEEIETECIPYVYPMGGVSPSSLSSASSLLGDLGKSPGRVLLKEEPDFIGEGYEEETRVKGAPKNTKEMLAGYEIFDDQPARKTWKLREIERESMKALLEEYGHEKLVKRYAAVKKHRDDQFCPLIKSPSTFLQLMPNLERFMKNLEN